MRLGGGIFMRHPVTVLPFPALPQQPKQSRRPRKPTNRTSLRQAHYLMDGLDCLPRFR
jgi:hypothetical protein